ncbi:MAG TPA: amino acid adenylation domain-containing protein [Kamptonema sp.]|nr:amino acid adenylation domain-containing protein [Kamptonema sp.]
MKSRESCIHTLVESQVEQTPNSIAAIFHTEQITYQELNQKANQLAHYLKSLGVKSETLIGVCVYRSLNMLIGLLGVLKAGGAYVPLDPSYPPDRIALMLEDSQLSVLITQEELLETLTKKPNITVCLDRDWGTISQFSNQNIMGVVSSENLAYTIYTSGSTGKPKGVQILHRAVVNLLLSMQQEPGITSEDVVLGLTTFSFDLSVPDLFLPLIVGATQVIVSREVASDANQLAKAIAESGATFIQATPATWRMLLAIGWQGKPDLKIICGGEAMTRALANQLLERCASLWNMYGPTETTVWSIISKVEPGDNVISIGKPILNTQTYLFKYPRDRNDIIEPVVDGSEGELYIGGMGLARGYLNRPELNEEKFVNAPGKNKSAIRVYKTGDLVRYLTDGTIEFIGRVDDQVKIRGFRIELGDIESALSQHPAVREVAVTTKDDPSGHKRIFAYFTSKDPSSEIQPSVKETYDREVSQWQTIWNTAYSDSSNNVSDPTLNTSGYVNSYTGSLIPLNEISDWVNHTVERILSLHPQRVLEIGCGTGMLLFRIAPQCSHYLGIDVSDYAISYLQQQLLESKEDWNHVTLEQRAAHDIQQFENQSFDTIVINSVIQYFPNFKYLLDVLNKAVKLVKPGGHIFIGDLRSLQFLKAFHASVQLSQAVDTLSTAKLRHKITQKIAQEQELLIDPDFFKALKYQIPQISHADILLKRGRHENELVKFRFDAILYVQKEINLIDKLPSIGWQSPDVTFSGVRNLLLNPELEGVKIAGVPNVRVINDLQAFYAIENHRNLTSVKELRQFLEKTNTIENINPEDFYSFAQDFSDHIINITWSESDSNYYDVIFLRKKEPISVLNQVETIESPDSSCWANTPFRIDERTNLGSQLRAFLQEKLPEYMIPSLFVLLETIPLTPNGKIDRRALPEPEKIRPDLQEIYVEPYTALEKQLATIWSELLGIEQIGIYDSFFELGGHSLLSVHLLARIQETLDINIPLFYLFKDPTIAGIIKAIDTLQELGDLVPPNNITGIDLQAEVSLDPEIRPSVPFSASVSEPKQIFLTGATGFLGSFLLYELLQQTPATIYCLVRASSIEEGKGRIKTNLERYGLWDNNLSSRIIPVLGDLAHPNLGVTAKKFQFLASSIDVIYHSGAMINLIYPYKSLRACNVLGTQEILRLASQVKAIPVNFISTLDVFQSRTYLDREIVLENDPLQCIVDMDRGYALSKWIAEKLILEAKARGIPVIVYRPEMISGHSDTGVVQTNDLLSRFLKGLVQLKAAPDLNLNIHMIPVDYVSQAIVHLSLKSESLGKVFHCVNPSPLPFNNLIHQIRELGYSIEQIAYEKWLNLLLDLDITHGNALTPLISLLTENKKGKASYLEESLLNSQVFSSNNTLDGLRDTSIVCPPVNAKLIQTYFSYFTQSGFFDISG